MVFEILTASFVTQTALLSFEVRLYLYVGWYMYRCNEVVFLQWI